MGTQGRQAGVPLAILGPQFSHQAATTAARYGIPDLARPWASDAYQLYARTPVCQRSAVVWHAHAQ